MSAYLLLAVAACALAAALLLAVDANRLYGYTVVGPFAVRRDGKVVVGVNLGRFTSIGVCFFDQSAMLAVAAGDGGVSLTFSAWLEWPSYTRRSAIRRLAFGPVAVAAHWNPR